jgi:hypothetical protein
MSNLGNVVEQLRKERDQTKKKIEQLDAALKALTGIGGGPEAGGRTGRVQTSRKRRTISALARQRMATAQRARWAKWKAAQKKK